MACLNDNLPKNTPYFFYLEYLEFENFFSTLTIVIVENCLFKHCIKNIIINTRSKKKRSQYSENLINTFQVFLVKSMSSTSCTFSFFLICQTQSAFSTSSKMNSAGPFTLRFQVFMRLTHDRYRETCIIVVRLSRARASRVKQKVT